MSTRTQALTQSIPNQWAQSQLICFNEDQLSMSTQTLALHRLMPNHWAQSHMFQRGPAINVNTYTST